MLKELGADSYMFGEAYAKAKDTPGYQKITKIIESIDNYSIFAGMMRKKNSSLNEVALRILQKQDEAMLTAPFNTGASIPGPYTSGAILPGPETKVNTVPTKSKEDRKKELYEKKEVDRLDTMENEELSHLEKDQLELIMSMSMREDEERRKIEEEEDQILKQALELSSKEHKEEMRKKQYNFEEKERKLKEKEDQLRKEEERIRKEK